jgi:hypothetical protein
MEKSITQIIEGACDRFCKEYCKYKEAFENGDCSEDEIIELCGQCPVNELR